MSLTKIKAPFSDEQITALKKFQTEAPAHPFTCCSFDDCDRSEEKNFGILIPNKSGFVCPCGKYRQRWAWQEMIDFNCEKK